MANGYTSFPDSVQTFDLKTDVSSDVYSLWKQFNTYMSDGDFANANTFLYTNDKLQQCIIDAFYMNQLTKTVEELQTLFLDEIQTYIHETVSHKGEWNATTKYTKYNFVLYDNHAGIQTFECLRDDTPIGIPPSNATYWAPRSVRGEKGESGTGLTPRGEWEAFTQYYQYDLVVFNNCLWVASVSNIGAVPSDNSSIWSCALSMNIMYETMKLQNDAIDAIIEGTAIQSDEETGTNENTDRGITQVEIDNVLDN